MGDYSVKPPHPTMFWLYFIWVIDLKCFIEFANQILYKQSNWILQALSETSNGHVCERKFQGNLNHSLKFEKFPKRCMRISKIS